MNEREGFSPGHSTTAFLVLCARSACGSAGRGDTGEGTVEGAEPVASVPDWEQLLIAAHRHSMTFHLMTYLSLRGSPRVPEPFWKRFRAHFERQARTQILLTSELLILRRRLEREGIPFIPFKGPTLAVYLYGSPLLREYDDLDILVPKDAALRARNALCNSGYRLRDPIRTGEEDSYLRYQYEYRLIREDSLTQVGLHWRAADSPYFPIDSLPVWDRLESMQMGHWEVPVPCTEDLLLLLSVHGAKDQWGRLGWICDVGRLMALHPGIRWPRLLDEANRLGARRKLLLAVHLAAEILGIALSAEVIEAVRRETLLPEVTDGIHRRLFSPPTGLSEEEEYRRRVVFYMNVTERLGQRLKAFPRVVHRYEWMTPREIDQAVFRLPEPMAVCFLLAWPLRILGRFLLSPLRRGIRRLRNRQEGE